MRTGQPAPKILSTVTLIPDGSRSWQVNFWNQLAKVFRLPWFRWPWQLYPGSLQNGPQCAFVWSQVTCHFSISVTSSVCCGIKLSDGMLISDVSGAHTAAHWRDGMSPPGMHWKHRRLTVGCLPSACHTQRPQPFPFPIPQHNNTQRSKPS